MTLYSLGLSFHALLAKRRNHMCLVHLVEEQPITKNLIIANYTNATIVKRGLNLASVHFAVRKITILLKKL